MEIRPMTPADVAGADRVSFHHLMRGQLLAGETEAMGEARRRDRIEHLLATDPGGSWVAANGDGEVVGVAQSLVREGIWGFSLFAVHGDLQGRGIGRQLLDACLEYGRGARGHIILSSENPMAMRRYFKAGLELHPCVAVAGVIDRRALREQPEVREGTPEDFGWMDEVSRGVRGAGHGRDLPQPMRHRARLLVLPERAFVLHRDGHLIVLAARDERSAASVLEACLLDAPAGASAQVDFIRAGNPWAIEVGLRAGLALSPDGPVFTRGELGPLAPYLPSGAYL